MRLSDSYYKLEFTTIPEAEKARRLLSGLEFKECPIRFGYLN
jgi:hypothetical protein